MSEGTSNGSQRLRRTGPFGPAGEILPPHQRLEYLEPEDSMLDALEKLCDGGFNQAPVMQGRECLGVIRLFDVMQMLLNERWFREQVRVIKVRNKLKLEPRYIGVDEWVDVGFDWQQDDLALVGSPSDLKGMLTATDILNRLTDYARAFVCLEAFEHDTRALFDLLLPLPEYQELVTAAVSASGKPPRKPVQAYSEFEFWQYGLVFGGDSTFARLEPVCIWDRIQIVNRINRVAEIRNMLLHFRGRASARQVSELDELSKHAARALARAHERRGDQGVDTRPGPSGSS
jgi:hypothetical protein